MLEGRPVRIDAVGAYVPPMVLSNSDLEKMVDTSDEWIVERTGICERHLALPGTATSDMATEAARLCLSASTLKAEDIDLVIVASATPDYMFPATACLVQDAISARSAAAFDIEIGCSGFVYALATGASFVASGIYDNVLVIGAETLSRITNWKDRNTCVLFGDGAGAVLLTPGQKGQGIVAVHLGADGSQSDLLKLPAGLSRHPASYETVDQGLHYIYMDGRAVFKFAVKIIHTAVDAVLSQIDKNPSDIDLLVPHQANLRIIDSACRRLNIPKEKVVVNIDKYGNTSSASVPIALYEALQQGRIKRGDLVVLVAFGAGLSWASAAIVW